MAKQGSRISPLCLTGFLCSSGKRTEILPLHPLLTFFIALLLRCNLTFFFFFLLFPSPDNRRGLLSCSLYLHLLFTVTLTRHFPVTSPLHFRALLFSTNFYFYSYTQTQNKRNQEGVRDNREWVRSENSCHLFQPWTGTIPLKVLRMCVTCCCIWIFWTFSFARSIFPFKGGDLV